MKHIILSMVILIILNAQGLKNCKTISEYSDSSANVSTKSVVDYARGSATGTKATVRDYYDDVTVVKHTGNVTDFTKGSSTKHTGNVVDYVAGASEKHSDFVVDYARGTSSKATGKVRDYMKSVNARHSGSVRDYARGTAIKHTGKVDDVWSNQIVSHKHTGTVVDYNGRGSANKHIGNWTDYVAATLKTPEYMYCISAKNPQGTNSFNGVAQTYCSARLEETINHYNITNRTNLTEAMLYDPYVKIPAANVDWTGRGFFNPTMESKQNIKYSPCNLTSIFNNCQDPCEVGRVCSEFRINPLSDTTEERLVKYNTNKTVNSTSEWFTFSSMKKRVIDSLIGPITQYYYTFGGYSILANYSTVQNKKTTINNEHLWISGKYYSFGAKSIDMLPYDRSKITGSYTTISCPNNFSRNGTQCKRTRNSVYYSYTCPTGYTANQKGYSYYNYQDPNINVVNNNVVINSSTPPNKNCRKTISYNYYDYIYANGSTGGYKTYKKTDPDINKANPGLANNVNNNKTVLNNITHYTYDYYSYSCPTGYTRTYGGISTYNKSDPNSLTKNPELKNNINSSTPPSKNCYKDMSYDYFSASCPTGYTTVDSGITTYVKKDSNPEVVNPGLANNVNTNTTSKNCYKDVNFECYAYSCKSGYNVGNSGRIASRCNKTDSDYNARNDTTLDNPYFSSTPPAKNCSKVETFDFYKYSCPSGYSIGNSGIATGHKVDPDTENYNPSLSAPLNSTNSPSKNCMKNITYDYYSYSCPSPYRLKNSGKATYTKTDPDINRNNTNSLSATVNSINSPSKNCSYNITYNYYEYNYPSGYNVSDSGYSSYTKADPNINVNNIQELSGEVNSKTPPSRNSYKDVQYSFFKYTCPQGYAVKNVGKTHGSKVDTDIKSNNSAELQKDENLNHPPVKNCSKVVTYNYYKNTCPTDINTQGYGWNVVNAGIPDTGKSDRDVESVSSSLSDAVNSEIKTQNNCKRDYQSCAVECPSGMQLDVNSGVCYESYESECIKRGLVYDASLSKCVSEEDIYCLAPGYMDADNKKCIQPPSCTIVNGKCVQPKKEVCADGFIYDESIKRCKKNTDCSNQQIASSLSEYCQSTPYCYDSDLEMSTTCLNEIPRAAISCGGDLRVGNICYIQDTGTENLVSKKLLVTHEVRGQSIAESSFGIYENADCGEGKKCTSGINSIIGRTGVLCFSKTNGQSTCIEAKNCEFSGKIETDDYISSLWTENNHLIKATDSTGTQLSGSITATCTVTGAVGHKERKFPIVSAKMDGTKIDFWNMYSTEGYIGYLEFPPTIEQKDIQNGYQIKQDKLWKMKDAGFGVIMPFNGATYAISDNAMTTQQCEDAASEFGYSLYGQITGIPVKSQRKVYDIIMNQTGGRYNTNNEAPIRTLVPTTCAGNAIYNADSKKCSDGSLPLCPANTIERLSDTVTNSNDINTTTGIADAAHGESGRNKQAEYYINENNDDICYYTLDLPTAKKCVLVRNNYEEKYSDSKWSIMINKASNTEYFCSQLECGSDNTCQSANCTEDYRGNVISPSGPQPSEGDCVEDVCDANKQYFENCGKEGVCDTSESKITKVGNDCVEIECSEGGFDPGTKTCNKWQCPEGYKEQGGSCVKK